MTAVRMATRHDPFNSRTMTSSRSPMAAIMPTRGISSTAATVAAISLAAIAPPATRPAWGGGGPPGGAGGRPPWGLRTRRMTAVRARPAPTQMGAKPGPGPRLRGEPVQRQGAAAGDGKSQVRSPIRRQVHGRALGQDLGQGAGQPPQLRVVGRGRALRHAFHRHAPEDDGARPPGASILAGCGVSDGVGDRHQNDVGGLHGRRHGCRRVVAVLGARRHDGRHNLAGHIPCGLGQNLGDGNGFRVANDQHFLAGSHRRTLGHDHASGSHHGFPSGHNTPRDARLTARTHRESEDCLTDPSPGRTDEIGRAESPGLSASSRQFIARCEGTHNTPSKGEMAIRLVLTRE